MRFKSEIDIVETSDMADPAIVKTWFLQSNAAWIS